MLSRFFKLIGGKFHRWIKVREARDPEAVYESAISDRVRRYQLTHPELATEAMNRLAQALCCLTDPVTKRAYDALLFPERAAPEPPAGAPGAAKPVTEKPCSLKPSATSSSKFGHFILRTADIASFSRVLNLFPPGGL